VGDGPRTSAQRPKEVTFQTKSAIALEQLRWACAAGLPRGVVLMDAGYGTDTDLRTNLTAFGLSRHPAADVGMGAGQWAAAAKDVVGLRASCKAVAA
jgi:SRSO17 transposase